MKVIMKSIIIPVTEKSFMDQISRTIFLAINRIQSSIGVIVIKDAIASMLMSN